MKKIIGTRIKIFVAEPIDLERQTNEFLKTFDSVKDEPHYYTEVVAIGGNRIMVVHPKLKEE